MQLTSHFPGRLLLCWLLLASLAAAVCSLIWPAAHLGEEIVPVGNDSFYHARRILDAAGDTDAFYEFDPKIHAPEGSLLTWPWGYDYVLALLVKGASWSGITTSPISFLVWVPVAAVFISMGLLMMLTQRLGFSLWSTALAGLCVAISPMTQYLHGVGFVDHHFAEYIFVLGSLVAGLGWFHNPESRTHAILLGVVLGAAPSVHNGLFILQIPALLTLGLRWVQKLEQPKSTSFFCGSLLAAALLVALPSRAFREGMFEYFYLSWFHVYVAFGTAAFAFFFAKCRRTVTSTVVAIAIGLALLIPLAVQVRMAQAFLVGDLVRLDAIAEMFSVAKMIRAYGPMDVSNRYSLFIWLAPFALLYCLYRGWVERRDSNLLFWISAIGGLVLLTLQFRLHNFGTFALYIPWLYALDRWARSRTDRRQVMLAATVAVVLLYAPPLRNQLLGPMITANDIYFMNVRPLLSTLARECSRQPGVVLADTDAGHYIRYYTNCSVIANNFLLTQQHGDKVKEVDRLFAMSPEELLEATTYVDYVLVRPASIVEHEAGHVQYMSFSRDASTLIAALLLKPTGDNPSAPPRQFELLHQVTLDAANGRLPYARLYRLNRDDSVSQANGT